MDTLIVVMLSTERTDNSDIATTLAAEDQQSQVLKLMQLLLWLLLWLWLVSNQGNW